MVDVEEDTDMKEHKEDNQKEKEGLTRAEMARAHTKWGRGGARNIEMDMATVVVLATWVRETWRGLKKEEDTKQSREGACMMTAIKAWWINVTGRVVRTGLWAKGDTEMAELKEIEGTPAAGTAGHRAASSASTPAIETMIRDTYALVKDIRTERGLGTEKDERRLEGRTRTAKEADRIEAIETRGKQQVRKLERSLAPNSASGTYASMAARSNASASAPTTLPPSPPPHAPTAPPDAPTNPASLAEPAVIATVVEDGWVQDRSGIRPPLG